MIIILKSEKLVYFANRAFKLKRVEKGKDLHGSFLWLKKQSLPIRAIISLSISLHLATPQPESCVSHIQLTPESVLSPPLPHTVARTQKVAGTHTHF